MTITYRVLVIRQDAPRRANMLSSAMVEAAPEVLFEAAGPDAGRLLAFAPDEVAAALNAVGFAEASRKATGLVDVEALAAVVAEEPDAPAVNPPGHFRPAGTPAATDPAPRRKRRTKAEIAADEAAAKLAAQQAGADPATAAAVAQVGEAADTVVEAQLAQPVDEPAPEQHVEPAPAPAPVAAAAPAVPYNPFA